MFYVHKNRVPERPVNRLTIHDKKVSKNVVNATFGFPEHRGAKSLSKEESAQTANCDCMNKTPCRNAALKKAVHPEKGLRPSHEDVKRNHLSSRCTI